MNFDMCVCHFLLFLYDICLIYKVLHAYVLALIINVLHVCVLFKNLHDFCRFSGFAYHLFNDFNSLYVTNSKEKQLQKYQSAIPVNQLVNSVKIPT